MNVRLNPANPNGREYLYVPLLNAGLHMQSANEDVAVGTKALQSEASRAERKRPRWGLGVLAGKIVVPKDIDSAFREDIKDMFGLND